MYGKLIKAGSYIHRTYRIKEELGSGGSGAVYMAWHTRLQKYVVMKVVRNCSTGAVEVLRNEVEALKNIKSMHIPQVLDFFIEKDRSFTIMEYIDGVSFDKLLKFGRNFTQAQVIKWYIQLASALSSIHQNNVCHRDIKPSNIMRTINGDVCLIDFNSALVSGNNTGVISRSMGYASPEQYEYFKMCKGIFDDLSSKGIFDDSEGIRAGIEGRAGNDGVSEGISVENDKVYSDYVETALIAGDYNVRPLRGENAATGAKIQGINWRLSDIYSLGATMYHFLTRKRPPVKEEEVVQIPYLRGYQEGILRIIERSMRSQPSQRFGSAEELGDALKDIVL